MDAKLSERDALIVRLQVRIADLEAQVKASSRNSSKPPSSDGLGKPAPKSLRQSGFRRPGGQPGHPGSRLEQVADPDEVIRHEPAVCAGCGGGLADAIDVGVTARQVFDLPPITAQVIEHRLVRRRCACGTVTTGPAPARVSAPVQYGPGIRAAVTYLQAGQFLPKQRTADILSDLLKVPISSGTVSTITTEAAETIEDSGFLDQVRDGLAAAPVVHFDETGLRVEGKLRWVHSASTASLSLLTCHPKRGVAAMNDARVLPAFTGTAVHDAWVPYFTYTDATHALCGAHVLRELTAVTETTEEAALPWAEQAATALLDLKALVEAARTAGQDRIAPALLERHQALLRSAATIGVNENTGKDGRLAAKHRALARRLLEREDEYLRFATNLLVPFDNNAAEREVRMIKIRQKISGCMRTMTGATGFCTIRSYLATARKHGITYYDALRQLADGQAWTPIRA